MIQIGINIAVKGAGVSGPPPPVPVNTVLPVISGNTTLGSVLTTTDGTWTNSPTSYAYQWYRDGSPVGTNVNTYTLGFIDSSAEIFCDVIATNAGGPSDPAPSNAIFADYYAPVCVFAPLITGTTSVGSVLTTINGTWINSPSSFSYQWKRGATNIGTNATTYTLVQADAAQNISCVVTATNVIGSTNATGNTLYIYDLDAQTFITNATISNSTQQQGINNLVIGLKSDSLWTKMLAVYPFVGGTATTCKYNLKNPLDTNGAFRLNFVGGWTFSSNGVTPNGTTAYADTFLIPLTHFTSGNSSVSAYSRINNIEAGILLGTRASAFNTNLDLSLRNSSNTTVFHNTSSGAITVSPNPPSSAINFISSRINSANNITAQNGATNSQVGSEIAFSTFPIYISAKNNIGVAAAFSTRNLAFAHIGTGLTQAECTLFYNRIQTFQTTLGRQV